MNIPSIIYLGANPENEYYDIKDGPFPEDDDAVFWCRVRMNDSDIPYIRAEVVQKVIGLVDRGLSITAQEYLQECLKGEELADDPYLARQFLKDKLKEIDDEVCGIDPDDCIHLPVSIPSIMKIIKEIRDHLKL